MSPLPLPCCAAWPLCHQNHNPCKLAFFINFPDSVILLLQNNTEYNKDSSTTGVKDNALKNTKLLPSRHSHSFKIPTGLCQINLVSFPLAGKQPT